jgi:hypothetical protein
MFPPLFGLSSGFHHGERQVWAIAVLQRVLAGADIFPKQAAAIQDLSAPQWSLQTSCREGAHVSFQRLFQLPKPVLKALWVELLREHDDVVVIEQAQLQRAADVCVRLADALEARQQARMEIDVSDADRLSA